MEITHIDRGSHVAFHNHEQTCPLAGWSFRREPKAISLMWEVDDNSRIKKIECLDILLEGLGSLKGYLLCAEELKEFSTKNVSDYMRAHPHLNDFCFLRVESPQLVAVCEFDHAAKGNPLGYNMAVMVNHAAEATKYIDRILEFYNTTVKRSTSSDQERKEFMKEFFAVVARQI